MTTIVILFLIGIILIGFEVILPGGIIGAIGGISIVAGIAVSYTEYGMNGAFIAGAAAVALVAISLYIEFKILPNTKLGKRFFLRDSVEGSVKYSRADDEVIGQVCETATALGPTGFVIVNGTRVEAASKSGFIDKNEQVKITGRDNFRIIVSKI